MIAIEVQISSQIGKNVRSDENCFALGVQILQQRFQFHARFGIESGGGLVEHQERRIVNDGASDAQALLHPARQAVDERVALGFEIHQLEHFVHARGYRQRIHFVGAREIVEVFPDFQIVVEREKSAR